MFKKYNFIENKYISNFIKKVQQQLTDNVYDVDCFICFMPSEKNNQINKLSKFSHIIQKCKCNAKIHLLCLNIWIKQTQACPICRTPFITIQDTDLQKHHLQKHHLQKYYIVCIINIYVFIILIYNIHLFLCIQLFIHVLYQIYLLINL